MSIRFVDKYRPRRLKSVVGQRAAVRQLDGLLCGDKLKGNTVLISGPYGTGKTTLARIVARSLNCEKTGPSAACGKCGSCKLKNHPDIQEINAAEARGIDDVRRIIDSSTMHPRHKSRVYILDEIHQMTPTASQSLLKILEEPPPHVTFLLVTTDPHRLLPTIRSRAIHLKLTPVKNSDLVKFLGKISIRENLEYDDEVLKYIAELSQGHVRDALTLLEQLAASSVNSSEDAKTQLPKLASAILGATPHSLRKRYVTSLLSGEISPMICFRKVDNLGYFLTLIIDALRDYIVFRVDPEMNDEDPFSKVIHKDIKNPPPVKKVIQIMDYHMDALNSLESRVKPVDTADMALFRSYTLIHSDTF